MPENYIEKLELTNFTAFDHIELEFAPGVNVLIGTNGTGKTHILKVLYTLEVVINIPKNKETIEIKTQTDTIFKHPAKLETVFLPDENNVGRLINRSNINEEARIRIYVDNNEFDFGIVSTHGETSWTGTPAGSYLRGPFVYIPPKDILSNSPGFIALYELRKIHFEEIYKDILLKAQLPQLKKPFDEKHEAMLNDLNGLLAEIEKEIGGKIVNENDAFYVQDEYGKLEFSLLAEGYSKLGLLWQLIRNGSLAPGATLFWDEPETNLNPELMKIVAKVLMVLQRHDVQVFLATHSYIMLKEIDLAAKEKDSVRYHRLYKEKTGIKVQSADGYLGIVPNVINDTYLDAYERELDRDERLNDREISED